MQDVEFRISFYSSFNIKIPTFLQRYQFPVDESGSFAPVIPGSGIRERYSKT
ncbi:hypothetical protein SAMN05443144_101171 [Fodinibius roseus]|uniref:Uncharacterized protein n=1 Tax=Fodinibius roseus TaxID=1194090 RepID=A0A1M4T095_9BACT|nr:hypothetical protein SAMN05443144_101171 [Fodinibius roseus]